MVSLEKVDTSDLPAFREIFRSMFYFWRTLTVACAFCSAPRKGLILLPFGGGGAVARIITLSANNAEMKSSGRLSARLLM